MKRKRSDNDMHRLNPYRGNPPDFQQLAEMYPEFKKYTFQREHDKSRMIDWKDPEAVKELTKTLLHHDFHLKWDIPVKFLCPPLPNRINYICWMKDLLGTSKLDENHGDVQGIDIGTGANLIYPLLGNAMFHWKFLATEIDEEAWRVAQSIIKENQLESDIRLKLTKPGVIDEEGPIRQAVASDEGQYLFVMCNPPFFRSIDEARQNPSTTCTGTMTELVTEGGEADFIKTMIADSCILKSRIYWYTTMVGKKRTVRETLAALRKQGLRNIRTTEFLQGKTRRWGVAWSFTEVDSVPVTDKVLARKRKLAPVPDKTVLDLHCPDISSFQELNRRIQEAIQEMGWEIEFQDASCVLRRSDMANVHLEALDVDEHTTDFSMKKLFYSLCDRIPGEVQRNNRKWRRKLKKEG